MDHTRVLIVDDHEVARKGVRMFMSTEPSIEVVGEAEDGQDAVCKARSLQPDVILMDLAMPGSDGIQAMIDIKNCVPNVKVIVLTMFDDEARVHAALQAGADGYLLKADAGGDALVRAIQGVWQRGEMPLHPRAARHLANSLGRQKDTNKIEQLTDRETEVLQLVTKGLANKEIAQTLTLSEGTVKIHVSRILRKLDVSSRTEAAFRATQIGLVSSSSGVEKRRVKSGPPPC